MPNLNENLKAKGTLEIVLTDSDGKVKDKRVLKNLVVDTGREFIAQRLLDDTAAVMSHMALGTGTTAAAAADTTLETENVRVALNTPTRDTTKAVYVASFPAGSGVGALTEAGIFNAATDGTMLSRTVFGVLTKSATDNMSVTWTIEAQN